MRTYLFFIVLPSILINLAYMKSARTIKQASELPLPFEEKSELQPPMPKGGLKAIKDGLQYPLIAIKAGIETIFVAKIEVDSLGGVKNIELSPFSRQPLNSVDERMFIFISNYLRKFEWQPGTIDGRAIDMTVMIPFLFSLKDDTVYDPSGGPRKITIFHSSPIVVRHDRLYPKIKF